MRTEAHTFFLAIVLYTCDLTPGLLRGKPYFLGTTFFHKRIAGGCCWQHCTVHSCQHDRRLFCLTVLLPGGVFILCESSNRCSKSKESHFVTVICQAHLTSNMCSTVALRTHYITHGSCRRLLSPPIIWCDLSSPASERPPVCHPHQPRQPGNYIVAAPISSHLHLAPGEQYLVRCRAFIYIENGGRFDILKDLPNWTLNATIYQILKLFWIN